MFKRQISLIGLIILALGLVSCHSREAQEQNATTWLAGEVSGFMAPTSLDDQVKTADSIALVIVENVGTPQWNVSGIESPASIQQAIQRGESPVIFRPVTLQVEKYLKNPQQEPVLTVHQVGGELDGVTITGFQQLEFEKGMKLVVFLERQQAPSPVDWDFSWAYVIRGNTAYSVWDQESLAVDQLLNTASAATE